MLDTAGLVKVGSTANLLERFKALANEAKRVWGSDLTHVFWFPSAVAWDVEHEMHQRLQLHRASRGRSWEWYAMELPDIDALPALIADIHAQRINRSR